MSKNCAFSSTPSVRTRPRRYDAGALERLRFIAGARYLAVRHHQVDPGREVRPVDVGAVEDQLGANLLRQRGAGFRPGRNDDVVVTKDEVVPAS
jgi:hypothetical protein